ncbi:MAG: hypothetical protein PT934_05025 [Peptoniphilaceae bacterium]|uniref:hypothetical protein n=1 Tax=Parvimonas sp. TaxID=1944660 RepID=UPI0025E45BBC|nr:hypothetical protein [Parvimonas sp.]MCI5997959.1 hypothetical protein [Parvimonas sp.]MDD7765113.1 hypothetical protein [Peptoniphilaceae bacterium]MDY3051483.1 hypothetical protein [Parvimonas sp.]
MIDLIKNIEFVKKNKFDIEAIVENKEYILKNSSEKYVLNLFPYGKYGKICKICDCLNIFSEDFEGLLGYADIGAVNEFHCYRIIKFLEDEKENMNEVDSYSLGIKIGKFIFAFHNYFKSADCGRWNKHYNYRINKLLHEYGLGNYRGDIDYIIFDFLDNNKRYLRDRVCTTIMGINSIDEIKVDKFGNFQIIEDYKILRSDSYFEFRNLNLDSYKNEFLLTGIIDGYFNKNVPRTFFKLMALYNIVESLYGNFSKAVNNEDILKDKIESINRMYDSFSTVFPVWYLNSKNKLKNKGA